MISARPDSKLLPVTPDSSAVLAEPLNGLSKEQMAQHVIGDEAFAQCISLEHVTFPQSLLSIGDSTFQYCASITSIELPHKLESVGRNAFGDCRGLTSLKLPHGLKWVGVNAFARCTGLTSVVFQPGLSVPGLSLTFIVWAVGSSRNRDNWEITTLKSLRNVLSLIAVLTLDRRDVSSLDPHGCIDVFEGCNRSLLDAIGRPAKRKRSP